MPTPASTPQPHLEWPTSETGRHLPATSPPATSSVGDAEVPTFSLGGPLGYAWAPDGKEMAYVANLDEGPS